jgi:hypothetical protein
MTYKPRVVEPDLLAGLGVLMRGRAGNVVRPPYMSDAPEVVTT